MNKETKSVEASHIDPSFITLLQNHRHGGALNELGQAFRTVGDAAQLTGKPGGITLKILINPTNSGALEIMEEITVKMPKAKKEGSLFFFDENGHLTRNNPNQLEMPLRSIEGGGVVDVNSLRQVSQ